MCYWFPEAEGGRGNDTKKFKEGNVPWVGGSRWPPIAAWPPDGFPVVNLRG